MAIVPVRPRKPASAASPPSPRARTRPPSPAAKEAQPDDGYRIGNKCPPREHQYKKGHKGGPGRPPKSRNLDTVICEVLEQSRKVMLEGVERKLQKVDMIVHKQVEQAMKGQHAAARDLLDRYGSARQAKEAVASRSASDTSVEDDLQILAEFRAAISMGEPVDPPAVETGDTVRSDQASASSLDVNPDEDDWLDDEEDGHDDA